MKKKVLLFHIMVLALLITGHSMLAQTTRIRSSIDRNTILIGERINLNLEADIPETEPIRFFYIDSIDHFEIIQRGKIDTTNTSTGTILKQQLVLTSFDSGEWVIPSYILDPEKNLGSDSFIVRVNFSDFDSSQPYHPLKPVIEAKETESSKDNLLMWVFLVVALLLIVYLVINRKKKKPVVAATPADHYAEAMLQLQQLKKDTALPAKEFHTRLVLILRNYLERKKNITSTSETTEGIITRLYELPIDKELRSSLSQSLRMSDFVKFAKYQPSAEENREALEQVAKTIDDIEKSQGK